MNSIESFDCGYASSECTGFSFERQTDCLPGFQETEWNITLIEANVTLCPVYRKFIVHKNPVRCKITSFVMAES
jgi:hypothetical protein